jgi:DNA polymerase-4
MLKEHAFYLMQRCCRTLRQSGKACGNLCLKIRYEDFTTVQRSQKVLPPSNNELGLWPVLLDLFEQALQRRQRIRLIGVRLSGIVTAVAQYNLFADQEKRRDQLLPVLDGLRDKYGFAAIDWGRSKPRPSGQE